MLVLEVVCCVDILDHFISIPHLSISDQLTELRKAKLSRILCANGDYIDFIQPWVLLKATDQRPYRSSGEYQSHAIYNPRGSCDALSDIDLTKWQEGPYVS